jgi:hypothetical protein
VTYRYIKLRVDLTGRHIFSDKFWLTAILNSGKYRVQFQSQWLAAILSRAAIWLADTYAAVSFDLPLYYVADNDDLPLY